MLGNDSALLVRIATDTSQLKQQLDQAQNSIAGFAGNMKSALAGALAGISVGAAVSYLAGITKGAIEAGDRLGELSQITGVSVKTLSGLQVAAKTSGVDIETLAATLGKMSKNLTGVEEPGGNAARALNALGINAEKFKQAKVEDRLFILADALENVDNSTGEATAAMDLLVKGGSALIPMLSGGSEKLSEMIGVAEALGLVLTEETAASMDAVADTMTIMGMQSQGLGNVIAKALAPTLEGLSKLWLDNAKDGGKFSEIIGTVVTGAVKTAVSVVSTGVTIFKAFGSLLAGIAAAAVQAFQGNFKGAAEALRASMEDAGKAGQENAEFIRKLWQDELPKFSDAEKEAARSIAVRTSEQLKGNAAAKAQRDAQKELKEQQDEILRMAKEEAEADLALQKALQAVTDERVKAIAAAMREVESIEESNRRRREEVEEIGLTKAAVFALRIARMDAAIKAQESLLGTIELEEAERRVIEKKIAAMKEARALALDGSTRQALAEQADAASKAWERTAGQIEQALTDALVRGFDSGKSMVKSIGDYIVNYFKTTIARGIAQALMGAISAGLSGAANAAGGGSGAGSVVSGIGSLFSGGGSALGGLGSLLGGTGSFGLTGLMSTLTGTGIGTSLGAAGSLLAGGNIAGGLGMGLGALAPYALAAYAAYRIITGKGTGRDRAPAQQSFGFVNAAGQDVAGEGFYDPVVKNGGVSTQYTQALQGIASTVSETVKDLGGTLNDQLRYGLFTSASPDGKGAQVVANVTTPTGDLYTFNQNGPNDQMAATLASQTASMIAAALKASDFDDAIDAVFDKLGKTVTESELMDALEDAKTIFDSLATETLPAVTEAAVELTETAMPAVTESLQTLAVDILPAVTEAVQDVGTSTQAVSETITAAARLIMASSDAIKYTSDPKELDERNRTLAMMGRARTSLDYSLSLAENGISDPGAIRALQSLGVSVGDFISRGVADAASQFAYYVGFDRSSMLPGRGASAADIGAFFADRPYLSANLGDSGVSRIERYSGADLADDRTSEQLLSLAQTVSTPQPNALLTASGAG